MMMLYPGAKSPDREGRDQGGHDQGEVGVVPGLATREGESQEPGGDGQAAEGAGRDLPGWFITRQVPRLTPGSGSWEPD